MTFMTELYLWSSMGINDIWSMKYAELFPVKFEEWFD